MSDLYTVSSTSSAWYQKYRPQTVEECVLTSDVKSVVDSIVESTTIPSMLLVGSAGTGKTSLAMALCNQLNASTMVVNASLDANLELIRTSIQAFASTVSLTNSDQIKVVILDELDSAPPSFQPALRSFMETFSNNVSFIITANHKNKIIDPIRSRCQVIEFNMGSSQKPKLASQFFKRVCNILTQEGIKFDKVAVAELVTKKFPDFRSTLNTLQMYAAGGTIDTGVLSKQFESELEALKDFLIDSNFTEMRKWLANNQSVPSADLVRFIYDKCATFTSKKSLPDLVMILGKYQYQAAFVADREINDCAMLTELMLTCEFER